MAMKRFSEDYDKQQCIDSCRFWMMVKMKLIGDYWNKKYESYLSELKAYLLSMNSSKKIVNEEVEAIQLSAYNTITESFFK